MNSKSFAEFITCAKACQAKIATPNEIEAKLMQIMFDCGDAALKLNHAIKNFDLFMNYFQFE